MALPLVVPLAMAGVGAAAKLSGLPESYRSERRLRGDLDKLRSQPMARYKADPTLTRLYEQSIGEASAPEGYGGAEVANFRNTLGRLSRGRFAAARSAAGGQGSRAINSILRGQEMDAAGNFFAGEAGIRRSNRLGGLSRAMSLGNQFQNIRDRNTSFDQNYRLGLERSLGEGIRSQRDYRRNMFNSLGSDLISSGVGLAYGQMGGGGGNTEGVNFLNNQEIMSGGNFSRRSLSDAYGADINSTRSRMRGLGAYNNTGFDFGSFDDGSPVRMR